MEPGFPFLLLLERGEAFGKLFAGEFVIEARFFRRFGLDAQRRNPTRVAI